MYNVTAIYKTQSRTNPDLDRELIQMLKCPYYAESTNDFEEERTLTWFYENEEEAHDARRRLLKANVFQVDIDAMK